MTTDKVSILTPTLNAMKYIRHCVESVMQQEYANIEHVFADAGSTDGTIEYLTDLSKKYPERIKLVRSTDDSGVGDGLNSALKKSTGSIIGWLDADDMLEEKSILQIVDYLNKNTKIKFIFGNCNIINPDNKVIGEFLVRDFDRWEWVNRWHYIIFCSAYFRREVVDKVGFVNSLGNDLDFFLRASRVYELRRVSFTIANWRFHEASISHETSPRSEKIRFKRAQQDFFLVLKHRGSVFSPKSINFLLILGKKMFNNKTLNKAVKILGFTKIKNLLVYNITNSNIFIAPNESFFRKLLSVIAHRYGYISKIVFIPKKIKKKFIKISKKEKFPIVIFQFLLLELRFQVKKKKRKKYYKNNNSH